MKKLYKSVKNRKKQRKQHKINANITIQRKPHKLRGNDPKQRKQHKIRGNNTKLEETTQFYIKTTYKSQKNIKMRRQVCWMCR